MDGTLAETKARLRREALRRRDALPVSLRIEASIAIAEAALPLLAERRPGILGGYLPIRSEVDPRPLMALAVDLRIRLAVPAIVGPVLDFRALVPGAPLLQQGHGTSAPGEDAERWSPDLLLVPLAAFDSRGHRIGYGGGFYDRAIAAMAKTGRRPSTVGLAFAAQEVASVPDEPFDVPLDFIVTEAGVVDPRAQRSEAKICVQ